MLRPPSSKTHPELPHAERVDSEHPRRKQREKEEYCVEVHLVVSKLSLPVTVFQIGKMKPERNVAQSVVGCTVGEHYPPKAGSVVSTCSMNVMGYYVGGTIGLAWHGTRIRTVPFGQW